MNGRPLTEIDWNRVEKSLMAGCSGMQIAANLGIHEDTLYRACEREKEMTFAAFAATFRQKGKLRPELMGELKVQNRTNRTRPLCARVRGGAY